MVAQTPAWASKIWSLRRASLACSGCIRVLEAGNRYYIHPKTGAKLCSICYEARLQEERRRLRMARASSR